MDLVIFFVNERRTDFLVDPDVRWHWQYFTVLNESDNENFPNLFTGH